jgi:hypothetical protein
MSGLTIFPYDCFKTEKIFTLKDLDTSPISVIETPKHPTESIFKKYVDLIKKFIADNKLDSTIVDNNNDNIKNLSGMFELIKGADYKDYFTFTYNFCKTIYDTKYLFVKEGKNYLKFASLARQININKNLLTKNLRYENPVMHSDPITQIQSLKDKIDEYDAEEATSIDNVILGNNINFSLPSIGPIFSIYSDVKCDISTLIYTLITTDNIYPPNYLEHIPLFKQNITETLSNILLENNKENNLWNVKLGNSNNNKASKIVKKYFNNVSVSIIDIFFEDPPTFSIPKNKYFIPYKHELIGGVDKISDVTSIPSPILPGGGVIKPFDRIKALIDANNDILEHVITQIYSATSPLTYLNNPNVKDILSCYIFFVINLFYDFYKKYIDKLYGVILILSDPTKKSKYNKDLNISAGSKYIERLNISLLNFKKILLNDFYELFLPSTTVNNNYGMILNKNGFYIRAGDFISSNHDIKLNFPFKKPIKHLNLLDNQKTLINFILLSKSRTDYYDDNIILELGGFSYNNIVSRNTISILNNFFDVYKKKNQLNIYLLELLEKFFKEKSCDVLNTYLITIINETTTSKKEKDFEEYYKKNLFSSATYFIEVIKIDKKIKSKKTSVSDEEYKKRNIYLLTSQILLYNSEICKYLLRDPFFLTSDITRRQLSDKIKDYSATVYDKITLIQQKYKENKIVRSSINKPVNNTTTISFWESFKNKISNKKLLVPIINTKKNEIIFIDIIEYAINGSYSDNLIFTIPKDITQNYIIKELMNKFIILFGQTIKDIKQNKFITIKSEFIEKMKMINDPDLVRKKLYKLITDIIFYNTYSTVVSSSSGLYNLFKTFIKNKSNNFNRLIISHIQVKKIAEGI